MKKGEIWLVELPVANSHEQAGARPVIILSELEANIAIIIPFTSNVQALRFQHTIEVNPSTINGLKSMSIALVFQLRAIDKKRLRNKVGILDPIILGKIDRMIKDILDL
ncbi:MAG: type II toxin-antitoxin system PemK/MazF family toxin [Nanoarchaeota archaeon]|nr:type II toxin-antitoxin system PemK/MazF family toxin [Nanoarchaeota archaeon]